MEIGDKGEEKRHKGEEGRVFTLGGTKVSLEKEKADLADRQITGKW